MKRKSKGWRSWPYWLKGGVIASLIVALIAVLFLAWVLFFALTSYSRGGETEIIGLSIALGVVAVFFAGAIVLAFGIGGIIGWIVGKIKNG